MSDYVSPPADLQTRTCSTKSERKQQNTTVPSVCWGWVWSELWPDHHQQESSVLHRMSSDLIIMDIWSSHSLSLTETANHKTILTLPHYKLPSLHLTWTLSIIIIANMKTCSHLVLPGSKKRNKTKAVIVELVVLTSQGWTPSSKYLKWKENLLFLQTLGD